MVVAGSLVISSLPAVSRSLAEEGRGATERERSDSLTGNLFGDGKAASVGRGSAPAT